MVDIKALRAKWSSPYSEYYIFTDALDSNSNKKALSEADKVLKKHPKFLAAKALKALAILRLGREDESNYLLESIMNEKPVDDGTLQVLTFCFKEIEQCMYIVIS